MLDSQTKTAISTRGKATLTCWRRQLEPKAKRERTCPKISLEALLEDVRYYPKMFLDAENAATRQMSK